TTPVNSPVSSSPCTPIPRCRKRKKASSRSSSKTKTIRCGGCTKRSVPRTASRWIWGKAKGKRCSACAGSNSVRQASSDIHLQGALVNRIGHGDILVYQADRANEDALSIRLPAGFFASEDLG